MASLWPRPAGSRMIRHVILAMLLLALIAPGVATAHSSRRDVCANRLCTKYEPGTTSCHRYQQYQRVAKCFVIRAAVHFHQPIRTALYVPWRETRYQWWRRNTDRPCEGSYYARGLYQFCRRLWQFSVYSRLGYSPMNPKIAALAAMDLWAAGCAHHWLVQGNVVRYRKGC